MSDTPKRREPIRPMSRTPKRVAASLQECRCFEEVDRRMRLGWSSPDLARFIQDESDELTNLSQNYVKKMLDDYRKSIPPGELMLTTQNTMVAMNAAQKVANGIEELDKLNTLYDLQMDRIKIDVENEKKINKLFPSTGREIFYAMKILKQSSDLKMDLGIAKRQLGELSVTGQAGAQITNRYSDGVGGVVSDPDSRRKVLSMVEALMTLGARANIDASEIIQSASTFADGNVIDIEPEPSESADEPADEPAGSDNE